MAQGTSTIPATSPERERRGLWGRRAMLAALVAFLALGLAGVFGDREDTVSATAGGWELEVDHPAATRSGLSVVWRIAVRHAGGFDRPVQLATSAGFIELLDEDAIEPMPSSATADGDRVIWTFDPPPGEELVVRVDARVDPSRRGRAEATTSVLDGGRPVVSAGYAMRVFP